MLVWEEFIGLQSLLLEGLPATIGTVFSPADISGLQLWLDAGDISSLFQDSDKTTPVTADADPVGAWADKSGNSRDMLQATDGARLTYKTGIQNGLPILRGDGTQHMSTANVASWAANTVFVVVNPAAGADGFDPIIFHANSTTLNAAWWIRRRNAVNRFAYEVRSATPRIAESSVITQGAWHVLTGWNATSGAGQTILYKNGSSAGTATGDSIPSVTAPIQLFTDTSAILPGDVAEVLAYNDALATDDRQAVEAYLTAKWIS